MPPFIERYLFLCIGPYCTITVSKKVFLPNNVRKEVKIIDSKLRELRNDENRLLCKADDVTGTVETEGPHKSIYIFSIPVGFSFTIIRGNTKSNVTRTATMFIVENQRIAA